MAEPLVSIGIPTYRGAEFIGATIESVLAQSFPDFELWVIDDNSPDDTAEVVARYADPRIRYLRNERNLGPQGNWNRCLEVARGKYFKLLPHDDLLAPDCLRQQVAVLEQDGSERIALVFGARDVVDPSGRRLMRRGFPSRGAATMDGFDVARRCVRAGTNLIGEPGSGLFRLKLARHIGKYDASLPYVVDLDYWFRLLAHGDAHYTATPTSTFRISAGSWSVAIGDKQYHDFRDFVVRFAADPRYGISRLDRLLGAARARLNTLARGLIYRLLFRAARAGRLSPPSPAGVVPSRSAE